MDHLKQSNMEQQVCVAWILLTISNVSRSGQQIRRLALMSDLQLT